MKRTTKDLVTAFHKSGKVALVLGIPAIFLITDVSTAKVALILLTIMPILAIWAFIVNGRYSFNFDNGEMTFPATDVAHSFLSFIIAKPLIDIFRLRTIHVSEIERMYLNIERGNKNRSRSYNLNITGTFGSAKLEFKTRQKRDEVRNNLAQLKKKISGKNIDFNVAEMG